MKNNIKYIIAIISFIFILFLPFFIFNPVYGHDTNFHFSNIYYLAKNFSIDNIISGLKIIPEIGNNMGYGIYIFYPSLPHTICALIYKIIPGISIVYSVYFYYVILSFITSISTFYLSLEIQKSKKVALLSSISFLVMPYVLSNLFIRYAVNEATVLSMFPLILLGVFKLLKGNKKVFYFTFIPAFIITISSHYVMTLFITIILLLLSICYRKEVYKKENIISILKAVGIILIFTLPNIILFIQNMITNNYIVNEPNSMSSLSMIEYFILDIKELFIIKSNYDWDIAYFFPHLLVISFIGSLYYLYKNRKEQNKIKLLPLLIVMLITLIFILNILPWKVLPSFFYMIQFPWRLLMIVITVFTIIWPIWINIIKNNKYRNIIFSILLMYLVIHTSLFNNLIINRKYKVEDYPFDSNSGMGHQLEYLPSKARSNWDKTRLEIELIKGNTVSFKQMESSEYKFEITNIDSKVTIEIPRYYYKGYVLKFNNNNIKFKESDTGLILAEVKEKGVYTLAFKGTILYKIFIYIRLIFVIGVLVIIIYKKRNRIIKIMYN